jgi:3-phenylpropionate/trans-cinnamate dioxygenase ferredoxin component
MMARRVPLCRPEEVEPGTARRFTVEGRAIALVRIGDDFYAVSDTCSHEDFSLSEGEVWEEEVEIECPRHGSTFDLRSGAPCSLPATQPIAVYDIEVADGQVSVVLP